MMKRFFRPLLDQLRRLGFFLGRINAAILLTFSFYVLLTPMALLRRIRPRPKTRGWLPKDPLPPDHFKRQF